MGSTRNNNQDGLGAEQPHSGTGIDTSAKCPDCLSTLFAGDERAMAFVGVCEHCASTKKQYKSSYNAQVMAAAVAALR